MVAPSFQTYKVITEEPFYKNGRLYITVEHPNTKHHRDVRWYTEAEYARAYGKKPSSTPHQTPFYTSPKVKDFSVTGTNPVTIKGTVSASSQAVAKVLLFNAYGEYLKRKKA